jgi:hypothetical protein
MRAWYDHPLAGSVKGHGTAPVPPRSTSVLKYNIPNAHLLGTWLHQEHEGNAGPI